MTRCTSSVRMAATPNLVADVAGHVPNLPAWTDFFRSVGPCVDGRWTVNTVMGTIRTWIERDQTPHGARLRICSLVADRSEQAEIDLWADGDGCIVEFTVTLGAGAPVQAALAQRERMGEELERLRKIVEGLNRKLAPTACTRSNPPVTRLWPAVLHPAGLDQVLGAVGVALVISPQRC